MSHEFEKKVVDFCEKHEIFPEKNKGNVLVALSGGGDSVALLFVLLRIRKVFDITVEAAHLNHSLRGQESAGDENFCREICRELGVHITVEILREGEITQNKESVETTARNIRMAFLLRVADDRNIARIATGHTMDDQAETILYRIMRGTGPSGLAGILPVRDGLWVRPLLGVTRQEARDYLESENISFREDSTNTNTVFCRNRIRHEMIPFIREHFSPGITGVISRLTELSRVQENYLNERMLEAYQDCCVLETPFKILLDKRKYLDYHKALKQRVVRHCLDILEGAGRDTDMNEIENVLDLFARDNGIIDITASIRCGAGRRTAVFIRSMEQYDPLPLELYGETVLPMGDGRIIAERARKNIHVDGCRTVLVCPHIIKRYGELSVGTVKRGEFMIPFGMSEAVKVRDIISSVSIPKILRDSILVVRAGAVPVWICGVRASECLRITKAEEGTEKREEPLLLTFMDGICWS